MNLSITKTSTTKKQLLLPDVELSTIPIIQNIVNALNVPREVLASDEEITYGWNALPRELAEVPENLRGSLLVRMCVATSVGLFDGALNYIWNASIDNLRNKVKSFGYNVVGQLLQKKFEEKELLDMKDSELLDLCLKINLISEDGFYFLNQCRDLRNNYSVAHPTDNLIDDRELIAYIRRCIKYALSSSINPTGVDISSFTRVIKENRFGQEQKDAWVLRIKETHDVQRESIFTMLHGIYCDSSSTEQTRLNAIDLCNYFKTDFTSNTISELLNRHYEYQAKGNKSAYTASEKFFEILGLIQHFTDLERHNIISNACKRLMSVHTANDNFYNEPPFAERIEELVASNEVPDTTKAEFVLTIVTCYVGNEYGQCNRALDNYANMIRNFTPKEIEIMLNLQNSSQSTLLSKRLIDCKVCKNRYNDAVKLINSNSIPISLKNQYLKIISKE